MKFMSVIVVPVIIGWAFYFGVRGQYNSTPRNFSKKSHKFTNIRRIPFDSEENLREMEFSFHEVLHAADATHRSPTETRWNRARRPGSAWGRGRTWGDASRRTGRGSTDSRRPSRGRIPERFQRVPKRGTEARTSTEIDEASALCVDSPRPKNHSVRVICKGHCTSEIQGKSSIQ